MILTCCTNFILYKDCSTSLRVRNPSQPPIFPYLPIKPPIVVNSHGTSPSPLPSLTRHLKELFVGNQALDISLETYLAMDLDLFVDTDSLEWSKLPPGLKALIAISHPVIQRTSGLMSLMLFNVEQTQKKCNSKDCFWTHTSTRTSSPSHQPCPHLSRLPCSAQWRCEFPRMGQSTRTNMSPPPGQVLKELLGAACLKLGPKLKPPNGVRLRWLHASYR